MISTRGLARAAVVVAVVVLAAGAARADTQSLAISGQSAPGTGEGTYYDLDSPILNPSGQAVFWASLTGTSNGSTAGIFRGDGSTTTAIARDKWPAPGKGGGALFNLVGPALNASGQVAFWASLTGTSDGSTAGIFRGNGVTTVAIAREKWAPLGSGGGTFSYPYSVAPAVNALGQVAFWAGLTGTSDGSTAGIFRGDGGTPVTIAREKGAAPGAGGGTFNLLSDSPALNAANQVAFLATLAGTSDGSVVGVFRGAGGPLTTIARDKWAAPGTGGGTFLNLDHPILNASGQAAFWAALTGTSDGSTNGLFRGDGSSTVAIARDKWAAPGAGGGTFWYLDSAAHAVNTLGQVAFWAALAGTSDGSMYGVFRGDGSTLTAIAREKWAAPGAGGGKFNGFGLSAPALNATGQVAFAASLTGTVGGSADELGIFLADDLECIEVVRKGAALEGTTIANLVFAAGQDRGGQSGLNDYGRVAYWAELADGRQGNFLFTPELHWRAAGSGNWDTAANWTVGVAPARVHRVTIAPDAGLTVTGPPAPLTVKSLAVGARTSGTAVLDYAGTSLTVLEGLTVGVRGQVDQRAGTLAAAMLVNHGWFAQSVGATLQVTSPSGNYGMLTVGGTIGGALITNYGTMVFDGGTMDHGGDLINDFGAFLQGRGTVRPALVNNGTLQPTVLLTVEGLLTNVGTVSAAYGCTLRAQGGMDNFGTIDLGGGVVAGSTLANKPGGIIRGPGAVSAALTNQGAIEIGNNQTLTVSQTFSNSGDVILDGSRAILSGVTVANSGVISGLGRVANTLNNGAGGTVRAEGGVLTLGGAAMTNEPGSLLEVADGASLLVSQGLAANSGSIILRGGTFDNNGRTMTNAGSITGYGTLRTGGLTNNVGKNIGVGGNLDVLGTVTNDGTVTTQAGGTATFYNFVNGDGSFPGTGTVVFLGGFSPGHSPDEAEFGGDLTLGGAGSLMMELAGTGRGRQYDAVDVDGTLTLGGTLDVELLGGFDPQVGDRFDLLNTGSVSGTFDAIRVPSLGTDLAWDTSALYTTGEIGVVPEPATLSLLALGGLLVLRRRR